MASQLTINLICIAVVGHYSELDLAAASLSVDVYSIMGQSVIISMLGALDTQASQVKLGDATRQIFPKPFLFIHEIR